MKFLPSESRRGVILQISLNENRYLCSRINTYSEQSQTKCNYHKFVFFIFAGIFRRFLIVFPAKYLRRWKQLITFETLVLEHRPQTDPKETIFKGIPSTVINL